MPPVRGVGRPRGRGTDGRGPQPEAHAHEEREATPPPQPERRIEELFLRQNPPVFDGMGDPATAETWVRAIERIFNFLRCTDKECMTCVSFQLTGSADFWWEARRKTMTPEQLEGLTWEQFKTGVYEKYIPKSYRKKKEFEFYTLNQGKISVTEYDRTFCDMSRYAPEQVDTDEKMAEKFCAVLRHEIRMALASLGGLSYPESLSRALDIEAAMPTERQATAPTGPPPTRPNPSPTTQRESASGTTTMAIRLRRSRGKPSHRHRISRSRLLLDRRETITINSLHVLSAAKCTVESAGRARMAATHVDIRVTLQTSVPLR